MGEKDKTQKLLVGCKDVCAELLNVFVYDGMSYRRQYRKGEKHPSETDTVSTPSSVWYSTGKRSEKAVRKSVATRPCT